MALGILVLITALTISAVAIYYSIAGLVAIFAAAAIPIIVMGTALEIGKLVTAVWLHKYWQQAKWWLKTYLTTAVVVLMFITSMGIFGFLSKAHIEQTSASVENVAKVEQIDKQIASVNAVIFRAEEIIKKTETSGTGADQNIQSQIDKEQERIDTAYDRVKPAIDQINEQLKEDTKLYSDQIKAVDIELETLASMSGIDTNDRDAVKLLQQLVGARPDGAYGSGTARAVKEFKAGLENKKQKLFAQIEELKTSAKDEIKRLRIRAETEIDDSNKLIERLRKQLGTDTSVDIQSIIDEQNEKIKNANAELDVLTEKKFAIESEYRKLEAEVGPIKYIAEFVYGEAADKTMLEEAVRWVILIIIFVFDPLAVLLLIASQYTFDFSRNRKKEQDWKDYESKRAAMIAANKGPDNGTVDEPTDDDIQSDDVEPNESDGDTDDEDGIHERKAVEKVEEPIPDSAETKVEPQISEYEKSINVEDDDSNGMLFGEDNLKKNEIKDRANLVKEWANDEDWTEARKIWQKINPDDDPNDYRKAFVSGRIHSLPWEVYLPDQKKNIESLDELAQQRADEIQYLDSLDNWRDAKQMWKDANPHENLKTYKKAYIRGFIDKLPWEEYLPEERTEGYVQNEEQNEDSIWKRIKDDKPDNTA